MKRTSKTAVLADMTMEDQVVVMGLHDPDAPRVAQNRLSAVETVW